LARGLWNPLREYGSAYAATPRREEIMDDVSRLETEAAMEKPVQLPLEAYLSQDYARAEGDKLWAKVWQVACRVEEVPKVGDYVTYDILDESIIIVRTAKDRIQAFYNVCQHRGRRLTEGCGHTAQFYCRFHGWRWELNGENAFVLDPEDWQGVLNEDNLRLKAVQVDTWGGWVFVNMDPDCEPLRDFLEPACAMLDPFEQEKMRYRWRKWLRLPCNWKTAIEAFNESYHAAIVHPTFAKWGANFFWCRAENNVSWHGQAGARDASGRKKVENSSAGSWTFQGRADQDFRDLMAEIQNTIMEELDSTSTETLRAAANRLADELPAGTPPEQVMMHMMVQAIQDDAARGVIWPQVDPAHVASAGHDWHIFPNTVLLHGLTTSLCYRARPDGHDPDSCIFEAYVIELFPEGQEPKTEWVHEPDLSRWPVLFTQDFENMPMVQKGMHSRGFGGPRPSPVQELGVIHFHRLLAKYMGVGAPKPLK
jgi:phenylpropionate dioxygenase-like ring-hydroxylating dioxygenase large terminal subunit